MHLFDNAHLQRPHSLNSSLEAASEGQHTATIKLIYRGASYEMTRAARTSTASRMGRYRGVPAQISLPIQRRFTTPVRLTYRGAEYIVST